jgi:hypothetical protein
MLKEEEMDLRAISLISWALALREAKAFCPEINSLSEFLQCCVNKLLSQCSDPAASALSYICADSHTAYQRAFEKCRGLEEAIVRSYYE